LISKEEQRLSVFEKRVLRRISGPRNDETIGSWRKLHNKGLRNLHSSPNISRTMKSMRIGWAGHVARMEETRNVYWVSVEKPEGKRPLRRSRPRWDFNIRVNLKEAGWGGMDWIHVAHERDRLRNLRRR
jgi:hypothetical protein